MYAVDVSSAYVSIVKHRDPFDGSIRNLMQT